MANLNFGANRLSGEELAKATEEARIRKQQKIQQAIDNGVHINYINCSLSLEERETLVNISEETGLATIDTTIQRDITKCLNRGWKIIAITYRKSAVDENDCLMGISGMTFEGPANKISILSC